MEDTCLRTPHILEQINELIDNKCLVKCKEASRILCSNIENQKRGKFLTTRLIQSYLKNPEEFDKDWRIVIQKLPMKRLSEVEILVKDFYKVCPSRFEENWAPMHIAAERGCLDFCRFISKVSPSKKYKRSPLLLSSQAGHLEVSKFLYKEIEDKTPRTRPFKITAQHLAAKNGHLEVYKFLHEYTILTQDINPIMQERITPLHLAAQFGQFDVCKYICDNTLLVAPHRSDSMTPLLLAVHRGYFKVALLLIIRDANNIGMIIVGLMCLFFVYIYFSLCLFIFVDVCFYYPFSGVSRLFNEPTEFFSTRIGMCITHFVCALLSLSIYIDAYFSYKISPKLEF